MTLRQWALRSAPLIAFVLAVLFLGLGLLGYDPADPPGRGAEPPNAVVSNPCGPVGAALAHVLFTAFGWSSVLVPPVLLVAGWLWALRGRDHEWRRPALGLALILTSASGTLQKLAPTIEPAPPVGSGGYLGAFASEFLERYFGIAGLVIVLAASGVFGLALSHEALIAAPGRALRAFWARLRGRGALGPGELSEPSSSTDLVPTAGAGDWGHPLLLADPTRPPESRAQAPVPINGAAGANTNANTNTNTNANANLAAPAIVGPRSGGTALAATSGRPTAPAARPDEPFQLPPLDLLEPAVPFSARDHEARIQARALLLERTLLDFGYQVRVVQIDTGPVITQFEIELEAGLRVSKITGLANDLAIALAVPSVRIVAPIPGRTTVGIEVPNDERQMVRLSELMENSDGRHQRCRVPLFLGKDAKGQSLVFDLAEMPHLLMAGRTGTGKSVCLNAMILSILMTKRPDEVKLILIDPKKVELTQYKRVPHLMHPVVTDMKKAESLLGWACEKMDERYDLLRRAEVRNIQTYNKLGAEELLARLAPEDDAERQRIPTFMPYIVIVIDELADMMMTAENSKELEQHIVRLAQLARAVGMHLVLATQKPVVDVVTGLIKGNLPARIAFQVSNRNDSRVVLDEMGAERLLGNGDMLFLIPGTSQIIRAQGTYISEEEMRGLCKYLERYPVEFSRELLQLQVGGAGPGGKERGAALKARDELYEPAIEIVVREGRGSCSLLQRALGIGYGRAARLIDFMAEDGIVGEFKSGSAREVLYSWEEWEALKNNGGNGDGPAAGGAGGSGGEGAAPEQNAADAGAAA